MNAITTPQASSDQIADKTCEIYTNLHSLLYMLPLDDEESVKRIRASMAKIARIWQTYRDASLRGE